MLRRNHLAAIALTFLGCGGDEPAEEMAKKTPTPPGTTMPMPSGTAMNMLPPSVKVGTDQVTVELTLTPAFHMVVKKPDGTTVLDTLSDTRPIGDSTAYGAIGATHVDIRPKKAVVAGWFPETETESPWSHGTKVTAITSTATTAAIDLTDAADASFTVHVDLSVTGAEVVFDAKVTGSAPATANAEGDVAPPGINVMGQSFVLPDDEHFFGLGERFVTTDHRGADYYGWTEEGGIGGGESTPDGPHNPGPNGPSMTHAPIPFFLSSRGYGLWVETTYRQRFDLGKSDPTAFRVAAAEPHLRWHAYVHEDPRDVLSDFTAATGRPSLPAPWVFGPRRRVDRGSTVNGVPESQALRDKKVPTTMVDDTTHFLPIGSQVGVETELAAWTKNAHVMGFRPIAYFNAYVSVTDDRAKDLAAEGRANDYFVKLADGSEFDTLMISAGPQTVATIDMTNPDARTWYHGILQKALDLGYDGWMLDFGEYLPVNARMADGRTGWEAHNAFPVEYQKTTFEYLRQARGDDFMFFARAGGTGTAAYAPVMWSGDPSASFDDVKGLPANVRAGLSAAVSGIAFWGSDISGYTCLHADTDAPDKELYLRWAEFGALSTDMHDENACAQLPPGTPTKWTLWSDDDTTNVYGNYARLHTRLLPYLYAAAKEATLTGFPVMRHPVLVHPREPGAWAAEFDYYFGPSLYVAPVVRRGQTARTLWLPPGDWVDFWTAEPMAGGQMITRDAPVATLPLFLRAGGVVAMLDPEVETLADDQSDAVVSAAERAGIYDVRAAIAPSAPDGAATLVDGTTLHVVLGSSAPAIPDAFTVAASEDELATCDACALLQPLPGGATRLRVSTTSAASISAGGVTLSASGAVSRVRWDVAVLGG